jgi:hypothetical protein
MAALVISYIIKGCRSVLIAKRCFYDLSGIFVSQASFEFRLFFSSSIVVSRRRPCNDYCRPMLYLSKLYNLSA